MTTSFEDFFGAIWGHAPHPWQRRLADRVLEAGWPKVLDLPTGSGKTAVLDIALFHLLSDQGRTASRRVILVVDRRVIVDQVATRAQRLLSAIERAGTPATEWARSTLRAIVGPDAPLLESAVLRGGVMRGDSWAHYPHVPVLAASTVDQVGSRLLFRGYGLSHRSQSIHAGLLGCDTLYLLDEVHLSRPFANTLEELHRLRGPDGLIPRRLEVVQLSATPGAAASGDTFRLNDDDRASGFLRPILEAAKPARLVHVQVKANAEERTKRALTAFAAAAEATQMVEAGAGVVGVVVNRVDTARRTWEELSKGSGASYDVELVTGRMRPLDQWDVLNRVGPRVAADRNRTGDERPLILVATQTIEAGADFDFDGLVTECASLDALRQRFGRLDRRGAVSQTLRGPASAVVLARTDAGSGDDPVYGDALSNTWSWLQDVAEDGVVDFGIEAMRPRVARLGGELESMTSRSRAAPALLPAHIEQWAQTAQRPEADPDISLYLHGIPEDQRSVSADVQVVWRADIGDGEIGEAVDDDDVTARIVERLAVVPPASLEAMSLPVWAVRRWLAADREGAGTDELADVEGVAPPESDERDTSRPVVLWIGARESEVIEGRRVRPGATIIVPASYGGIGPHRTFDPDDMSPPADIGDRCQLRQRPRAVLRLNAAVWPELSPELQPSAEDDETQDQLVDRREEVLEVFGNLRAGLDIFDSELVDIIRALGTNPRPVVAGTRWSALVGPTRAAGVQRIEADEEAPGEEDEASLTGLTTALQPHLEGVGDLAESFGRRLGLPQIVVRTLYWAGRLHDVGKADPRFQHLLHGDEISARFGPVLAKSGILWQDVAAHRAARRQARYPRGQRHELVALDMIERSPAMRDLVEEDGGDWELLLHLVASHHGWCRPLAPPAHVGVGEQDDVSWEVGSIPLRGTTGHVYARLDSGVIERFFSQSRRFGWHELAYLEAILRLADHRQSAKEEEHA